MSELEQTNKAMTKPYAEACDRNQEAIYSIIEPLFFQCKAVFEIGSGTGQHAVYFAKRLPHLIWYTSDLEENHTGINLWLEEAHLANTRPPTVLDVTQSTWPMLNVDAVFSANTAHILHWNGVEAMFSGVVELLPSEGIFSLYGPFNYGGKYTSDSNERFDGWLKLRDPNSAIRNFEDINQLGSKADMMLKQDYQMPANNRMLCWQKK